MPTLILTREEILPLLEMKEVVKAVENVLKESAEGRTSMPHKLYLNVEEGDFRAMPAATTGAAGIKWVNVHPGNAMHKLPTVMAVMIYNDPQTGYPLAIIDATETTAYRTGATSAVASKYLAASEVHSLGICGAGRQAYTQMTAHLSLFNFKEILINDKSSGAAEAFIKHFSGYPVRRAGLIEIAQCDIICTVTPSREPYLKKEWLKPGTHINAVGADAKGKEELDPRIISSAKVIVDDVRQVADAGEVLAAVNSGLFKIENIYGTLCEVVGGKKSINRNDADITVFISTGLAITDIAVARMIYSKIKGEPGYRWLNFVD